jgi:hypothetical protein
MDHLAFRLVSQLHRLEQRTNIAALADDIRWRLRSLAPHTLRFVPALGGVSKMVRRIAFSVFAIWALGEAILTARDMPITVLRFYVFVSSLVVAMLLLSLLYLLWGWVETKLCPHRVSHKT